MLTSFVNRLNMIREVLSVAASNNAVVSTIVALVAALARLAGIVTNIDDTNQAQIVEIKGIRKDKLRFKTVCALAIRRVSKALVSYAHNTQNAELEEAVKCSKSSLLRMEDEQMISFGNNILSFAGAHAADLVDYGVDAGVLSGLSTAIADFVGQKTKPKEARDARKGDTAKLNVLFSQSSDLLKNEIDPLVLVLPDQYSDFVTLYFNARSIINYGHRYREPICYIRGLAIDFETEQPLAGVSIYIMGDDTVVVTDTSGQFELPVRKDGTVVIMAERAGYLNFESAEEVIKGEDWEMNIEMEPVEPIPPPEPL